MKHARKDYDRIQDPQKLIPEDEPVFLLRAQDKFAPKLVALWALLAVEDGVDIKMVKMVRNHAEEMNAWQKVNGAKTPDLP